jgi:3-oxoacyl-(acyl-carrier-protein) synthase
MERRRVAVTGMGVVSSIGNDKEAFFSALLAGQTGIAEISKEDFPKHPFGENQVALAGRFDRHLASLISPSDKVQEHGYPVLVVMKAIEEAITEGDGKMLRRKDGVQVIIGSALGLFPEHGRMNEALRLYATGDTRFLPQPQFYPLPAMEFMMDTILSAVFKRHNLRGKGLCLSTICASGSTAVCLGTEWVRSGECEMAICIGFDHFNPRQNIALSHFKLLSNDTCIPFDRTSKGCQLGEGVGVLVLEDLEGARKSGANVWGEISGIGMTNDAYHLVISQSSGKEFAMAIEMAIEDACIQRLEDVECITLASKGSRASDIKELEGIKRVFGDLCGGVAVNSITPYTGYTLGASSVLSLIAALLQMKKGILLPIPKFNTPYAGYKMNYVREVLKKDIKLALVCADAFTGVNTAIAIRRYG